MTTQPVGLPERQEFDIEDSHLCVLRRWNSYSPRLPGATSPGGGYFVRHRGVGIAIDPGFEFLNNLQECRYWVDDIDVIVMTHSHIDHTDNFEPLLMLIHQLNRLTSDAAQCKSLVVIYNPTCGAKFSAYLAGIRASQPELFEDIREFKRVGSVWQPIRLSDKHIVITPLVTYHEEPDGQWDKGVGIVLELLQADGSSVRIAITGDSGFLPPVGDGPDILDVNWDRLKECSLVVAHLGSVRIAELLTMARMSAESLVWAEERLSRVADAMVNHPRGATRALTELQHAGFPVRETASLAADITHILGNDARREHLYGNHLGVYGVYRLFEALAGCAKFELGVISEFGEELGSYRHRVARVLNKTLADKLGRARIMTGDVGLRVRLGTDGQRCAMPECRASSDTLIECSYCGQLVCPTCVGEACIKHRQKLMVYYCRQPGCRRQEYAPPISRLPRVMPLGFGGPTET